MKRGHLALLALAWLGLPTNAAAQQKPAAEKTHAPKAPPQVAVGYTVASYEGSSVIPVGWFISVAAQPVRLLSVVGEVSGDYATTQSGLLRVRTDTYSFLNGLRLTSASDKKVRLLGEFLVGVIRNSEFRSDTSGANRFAAQGGLGFDLEVNKRMAVRFQGAARVPTGGDPAKWSARYATGIVVSGKGGP
jgi:hypothetical protein